MKQKAPITAGTVTGAEIRATEAAQTLQSDYPVSAHAIKGDRKMTCHNCRIECKKSGKRPDGLKRYRCSQCGKTFSDHKQFGVFGHKQIDDEKGLLALRLLVEGNSIRATERISKVHGTIKGTLRWRLDWQIGPGVYANY